ncbi:hypothetical protein DPMN_093368 [Dreissena polymorpha]|uniref:Uncharacterized protein n=1 Tax=Dreissena polymorpha TaxID=45954 RepID=A0A9D4R1T6_DREPO|nr:hypothetical protein DPMN_093368 [Dreissena polymorpha]
MGSFGFCLRDSKQKRHTSLVVWETLEAFLKFPVPRPGIEPGTSGMNTAPPCLSFRTDRQTDGRSDKQFKCYMPSYRAIMKNYAQQETGENSLHNYDCRSGAKLKNKC